MSSSSTTRAGARGATAKSQVPRPRGQRPRQPAGQANTERPNEPARRGGIAMPSMPALPIPRVRVPGNVLWWSGLAAVAALGIVDWPVAALVGAGTWVAEKHSSQSDRARSAR